MKRELPILKILAWTIIGFWLTRSMIFKLINIDFATMEIARNFRQIWLILIPLAIGILIFNNWKEKTSNAKKIIGLLIGILISTGLIIVLNFFSSFCEWQFSEPLYKHKHEIIEIREIRERILDCGAWDSDPTYLLVVTKSIGIYLIEYSEINEEDIDEEIWIKE